MPNHSTNQPAASTCLIFPTGAMGLYQERARIAFEIAGDVSLQPHAWIRATCGNMCLNPQHLIAHQPTFIAYPAGVCVYCGLPAGTKDHLIPRAWTGETRRQSVAVVPACAECNTGIGASGSAGIDDRRKIAHDRLRKAKAEILAAPEWSQDDLAELGPILRQHVEAKQRVRQATLARLAWPEDPFYDMRAWQKSGIDDPVALGVIANPPGFAPQGTRTPPLPSRQTIDPRAARRARLAFGSAIRRRRMESGLTQEAVAQAMRDTGFFAWSNGTVGATENGHRRTSAEERAALDLAVTGGAR